MIINVGSPKSVHLKLKLNFRVQIEGERNGERVRVQDDKNVSVLMGISYVFYLST